MRNRRVALSILIGLVLVALAAFTMSSLSTQPPVFVHGDGEIYATLEELRSQSDLIISGTVMGVVETYADSAGDAELDERGDALPNLPKAIVAVELDQEIKGESPAEVIYVVTADHAKVVDNWDPNLGANEKVVLHLFGIPREAPNMSPELSQRVNTYGALFGVVGGNQGVFDIQGNSATARFGPSPLRIEEIAR